MSCTYQVRFVKASDAEPAIIVPREIDEIHESHLQDTGIELKADSILVRLAIPSDYRRDSRSIVLLALEQLREHVPYKPFVLRWDAPPLAMHEGSRTMSTAIT